MATTEQVKDVTLGKSKGTIVGIVRELEFSGEKSHVYKFFESSGHIPTALWAGDWDELCDKETGILKDLD